jgi:hypothetical protein
VKKPRGLKLNLQIHWRNFGNPGVVSINLTKSLELRETPIDVLGAKFSTTN